MSDVCSISFGYAAYAIAMFVLTERVPSYAYVSDQVVLGIAAFCVGQLTNHYHHVLLSRLRQHGSKEYKVYPRVVLCISFGY